jgi:transposase-like protein
MKTWRRLSIDPECPSMMTPDLPWALDYIDSAEDRSISARTNGPIETAAFRKWHAQSLREGLGGESSADLLDAAIDTAWAEHLRLLEEGARAEAELEQLGESPVSVNVIRLDDSRYE